MHRLADTAPGNGTRCGLENNRKSVDAGIIDIIVGLIITAIGMLGPFVLLTDNNSKPQGGAGDIFLIIICGTIILFLGLFIVYGGEMAMKRRRWGLALAASICASLVVFGIPSLILTILSKKEFGGKKVTRK
jgi:hypothetical protein